MVSQHGQQLQGRFPGSVNMLSQHEQVPLQAGYMQHPHMYVSGQALSQLPGGQLHSSGTNVHPFPRNISHSQSFSSISTGTSRDQYPVPQQVSDVQGPARRSRSASVPDLYSQHVQQGSCTCTFYFNEVSRQLKEIKAKQDEQGFFELSWDSGSDITTFNFKVKYFCFSA